jgi:predicted HAD superfamily phosphohydrolase
VKRAVTFTEKTRFIYEINKGISMADSRTKPHLVNQDVPMADRRIPFENMIYVGDGLTDVPCFSLVGKNGGHAFAVFQPGAESAKQAFQKFLAPHRVTSMHFPRYRDDEELGSMIRSAVFNMANRIVLRRDQALK